MAKKKPKEWSVKTEDTHKRNVNIKYGDSVQVALSTYRGSDTVYVTAPVRERLYQFEDISTGAIPVEKLREAVCEIERGL
jgi:hypothetical protein